jgi:uncharacterized protein (DUF2147 family)
MRTSLVPLLVLPALLLSGSAPADEGGSQEASTPVGRWRTIDDATGKVKSIVAIWEEDGKLFGKVEQILDPKPDDPDPTCNKCEGELKDARVLGMRIMWDLKKSGDSWSGGKILDPDNGKTYKCRLALAEDGKKLLVRGYIGIALLGRTQTWIREE